MDRSHRREEGSSRPVLDTRDDKRNVALHGPTNDVDQEVAVGYPVPHHPREVPVSSKQVFAHR